MVKLRVTVRVIPEDVYLANIESTTIPHGLLRSEKRFCVVVREPETWYIGTLAIEIKRRYESLYKHDLGQIKYLKDNQDDCDLDTELYVADALVDEGRALADPSDQHVTVKVIQEQGRVVREGSVVPDLSQSHYLLPERPSRPPVPRFEDLGSNLGKRKPGENLSGDNNAQKRARLDEIEEELVASIEQDAPPRSDIVVSNSQPVDPGAPSSPELTWSFSKVGPPTIVQNTSPPVDVGKANNEQRAGSKTQHMSGPSRITTNGTPTGSLQRLNDPQLSATETRSPLAAASSVSKKFLKPRKDVFAEPESDIDDSQMSPDSRDTSRITPRLVPSGRAKGKSQHDQGNSDKIGSAEDSNKMRLENQSSSSNQGISAKESNVIGLLGSHKVMAPSNNSHGTHVPITIVHTAKDAASEDDMSIISRSSGDGVISDSGQPAKNREKKRTVRDKPDHSRGSVELSTPTPDSPSEQLSQALQESARKTLSLKDIQAGPVKSRLPESAADDKPANKRTRKRKSDLSVDLNAKTVPETKRKNKPPASSKSDASAVNASNVILAVPRPEIDIDRSAIVKGATNVTGTVPASSVHKTNTLAVPVVGQAMREASTESHITNSSKTIIPPGMTQEQYDRLVKGNAHLNTVGPKEPSKRKSTPSLRQTPSVEQPATRPDVSSAKSSRSKKNVASLAASTETAKEIDATTNDDSGKKTSGSARKSKVSKATQITPSVLKPSESTLEKEANAATSSAEKAPSQAVAGSASSKNPKADSSKVLATSSSVSSTSGKGGVSDALDKPAKTIQKLPTPTPSTASKATSSSSAGQTVKGPNSLIPPSALLPPSSSSAITTESASAATPTPKPRSNPSVVSKPAQLASGVKQTTNTGRTTKAQPAKSASSRPTLPPTFSSARTLQELRTMVNSTNNSTASSPAPTASRFAQPKKGILGNKGSDSSSSDDESSSDSDSDAGRPATQRSKPQPTPSKAVTAAAGLVSKGRPDPSIRDVSPDDDSSDDDDDDSDDD